MPGGLIQLKAIGAQDLNLTGNPQISFFKTVYRRYTNFAMEYYKLFPESNLKLNDRDTTTFTFDIKRNGDLVNNIYFNFTLPDIFSTEDKAFKWIKNIGTNIINKVTLFIDNKKIDENYGEWMNIWNELSIDTNKKQGYNEMIGNIEEIYNPGNWEGQGYPGRNITDKIPSIRSRVIRVPLSFWFNNNSAMSLPLIALQYNPVTITVELRKLTELYTIVNSTETEGQGLGKRYVPDKIGSNTNYDSQYSIVNFVKNITKPEIDIQPYLHINYIFLGKEEMKKFATAEHKYLIKQVRRNDFNDIVGSSTLTLDIHNPVSYMVIVAKRTDVSDRNDWNNYTNWIDEKIPPYLNTWENEFFEKFTIESLNNSNKIKEKVTLKNNNYDFKKDPHIINNLLLKLDGTDRFSAEDYTFFNKVVPFNYSKNMPKDGIYFYSFSLNPFDYQPSGSCNMSRFSNIELFVETVDTPIVDSTNDRIYKFDINVYSINYNVLRIFGGIGNVEFSN